MGTQASSAAADDAADTAEAPQAAPTTQAPAEVTEGAEIVILSVPSQSLRTNLTEWAPLLGDKIVVSLMKGIELGTTKRMSEVIADAAARIEAALKSDEPLTADERKSRDTIVSRQVTIR